MNSYNDQSDAEGQDLGDREDKPDTCPSCGSYEPGMDRDGFCSQCAHQTKPGNIMQDPDTSHTPFIVTPSDELFKSAVDALPNLTGQHLAALIEAGKEELRERIAFHATAHKQALEALGTPPRRTRLRVTRKPKTDKAKP